MINMTQEEVNFLKIGDIIEFSTRLTPENLTGKIIRMLPGIGTSDYIWIGVKLE